MPISRKETTKDGKSNLEQVPCGLARDCEAVDGLEDGGQDLFYGGEELSARPVSWTIFYIGSYTSPTDICIHLVLLHHSLS
jgi:hypothetical protein